MKKTILAITFGTMVVAFNNFEFFDWNQFKIDSVNEASRVNHAKELLGKYYKGSNAQKLEGSQDLNLSIYNKVQTKLQGKWKLQAQKISKVIITESSKRNFDPVFVLAVIETESKFNPLTRGSHGEIGLMQLKPDTAAWIAKKYKIAWKGPKTLENPESNIRLGLAYMTHLRKQFDNKSYKYVSAYNMGPTNVKRLVASNIQPKEYSSKVMSNYKSFYSTLAARKTHTMVADASMH